MLIMLNFLFLLSNALASSSAMIYGYHTGLELETITDNLADKIIISKVHHQLSRKVVITLNYIIISKLANNHRLYMHSLYAIFMQDS